MCFSVVDAKKNRFYVIRADWKLKILEYSLRK